MSEQRIAFLIDRYLQKTCLPEEREELFILAASGVYDKVISDRLEEDLSIMVPDKSLSDALTHVMLTRILSHPESREHPGDHSPSRPIASLHSLRRWAWAAASVLFLLAGVGAYLRLHKRTVTPQIFNSAAKNIPPGGNKAILTLDDGSTVALDSAGTGNIATQGNTRIVLNGRGRLAYTPNASREPATAIQYNTLTTPRAGQFMLLLPDQTKVWLNAASSIRYPLQFSGNERLVTITGEVYFEVVHDPRKPFRVRAGNQLIEDIGTSFNVNAYPDEAMVKTTLEEGIVQVNGVHLTPGQQAAVSDDGVKLSEVNVAQVLAWKNGFFDFNGADLHTVMRQLSRWYAIDVVYKGRIPARTFHGELPRDLTLSQVLSVLTRMEVNFSITDGHTLVVSP